jgi:hypothetical protein
VREILWVLSERPRVQVLLPETTLTLVLRQAGSTLLSFGSLSLAPRPYCTTTAYRQVEEARAELEEAFKEIKRLKDRLQDENVALREQIDQALMFEEIVGVSTARAVTNLISKNGNVNSIR